MIAGHKLSRVGDIWLGDDLIGTFSELVSYELHADRQTCDPFMLAKCADWKEDMIGQGITWLRVSLKFDAQKFPAGLPNIKVEKFGKEVWDPRDKQWKWSDNVALIILDYYRSWLNVPDDEIRLNEFIVAANICDELVTRPDGTVEPRYRQPGVRSGGAPAPRCWRRCTWRVRVSPPTLAASTASSPAPITAPPVTRSGRTRLSVTSSCCRSRPAATRSTRWWGRSLTRSRSSVPTSRR